MHRNVLYICEKCNRYRFHHLDCSIARTLFESTLNLQCSCTTVGAIYECTWTNLCSGVIFPDSDETLPNISLVMVWWCERSFFLIILSGQHVAWLDIIKVHVWSIPKRLKIAENMKVKHRYRYTPYDSPFIIQWYEDNCWATLNFSFFTTIRIIGFL